MKCRDVEYLLVELADGSISAGDRELIEKHMASCASCTATAALLTETFAVLRDEVVEAPPANYFATLVPQIRTRLSEHGRPWHVAVPAWLTKAMAPMTVTAMAVVLVGLFRLFEPTADSMPLQSIMGQVSNDEYAALVDGQSLESELAGVGGGRILEMLPNAGAVADRMKAEFLAAEVTEQQSNAVLPGDEPVLEDLDDEAVSQVLHRMNNGTTL